MKRRTMGYVAGACVAGLVAGVPAVACASTSSGDTVSSDAPISQEASSWSAPENMNVDLYGPPAIEDEPIQALYGPPISDIDPVDDPDYKGEPVQVLYGPPIVSPGVTVEPIQLLYGPPSVLNMKANPMTVRAADQTVKESRLASKAKVFKKAIRVKKAKGALRYKRVKKASSDKLAVNKKTGAVTIAQGTEAGDYAIRVRVTAAGNSKYRAAVQVVTVKVHVK